VIQLKIEESACKAKNLCLVNHWEGFQMEDKFGARAQRDLTETYRVVAAADFIVNNPQTDTTPAAILTKIFPEPTTIETVFAFPSIELNDLTKKKIEYSANGDLFNLPDNSKIDARRVEDNLDILSSLVSKLVGFRDHYGQLTSEAVIVRDDLTEFFALQAVHKKEVEAGLYVLPVVEAGAEIQALITSLNELLQIEQLSKATLDQFYTDPQITEVARLAMRAVVAGSTAPGRQDAGDRTAELAGRREALDRNSWTNSSRDLKSQKQQLEGRLAVLQSRIEYLKKDVEFKTDRTRIANQIAQSQYLELNIDGGPRNISQRLQNLKKLWQQTLVYTVSYARAVKLGLETLPYAFNPSWPEDLSVGNVTDGLSGWVLDIQSRLKLSQQQESLTRYTFWAKRNTASRSVTFEVNAGSIGNLDRCLRGASLEFVGAKDRPIQIELIPPVEAYARLTQPRSSTTQRGFQIGRVCKPEFMADSFKVLSDLLWNGSPIGRWTATLREAYPVNEVESIALHLWLVDRWR
jgi:hypothetical protein